MITTHGVLAPFLVPKPAHLEEWEARRPHLRRTLWKLLGQLPPRFTPNPRVTCTAGRDGYILEEIEFDNGAGGTVYGSLLISEARTQKGPAILYNHYHGGEYEMGRRELFNPWPTPIPPGKALVDQGYVVLAIDAYGFNDRRGRGPAGERETGRQEELSLFKKLLWEGRTLWGMMLRDDILALNYLLSRPEVDPTRVGATGMSMGSTRTWWLAALDDRIKAAVCVACLTRYQNLIANGDLDKHGIYYFVPNVLREGVDMEAVVGLIAPRPLLFLTGDEDPGSPIEGINIIADFVSHLYGLYGAADRFQSIVYAGVGHDYTPQMVEEMLAWFREHL